MNNGGVKLAKLSRTLVLIILVASMLVLAVGGTIVAAVNKNSEEIQVEEIGVGGGGMVPVATTADDHSLVPLYTFAHSDVIFVGLHNGTVVSLDSKTGSELWRLDTGGKMVSHDISVFPSPTTKTHPFALPFGVKGLWVHTRDPTSPTGFSETPFLHVNQLMQRPHFRMMENVDIFTTTSADSFDVADSGLLEKGQKPLATSPVVHIIRYNVHIRVRQIGGFEWNVTVGSLKVAVSPPSDQGANDAFSKRQTFYTSRDKKREHLVVDEEMGGLINYVFNEKLIWSKQLQSSPVAAFRWSEHLVENIDLLGSDTHRVLQLTMEPELQPPSVPIPVPANNAIDDVPVTPLLVGVDQHATGIPQVLPGDTPTSAPYQVPPAFDYEKYAQILNQNNQLQQLRDSDEWIPLTRMHIFFMTSILLYLLSVIGIVAGISQRNKLRQAWGQLDSLQSQLKEQQRVNAEMPLPSPGLFPQQLDSVSMYDREETGESGSWNLPPSQNTVDGLSSAATEVTAKTDLPQAPQASLFNMHFNVIKQIGGGGGGVIFEAKHKLTNTTYAIKMIALLRDDERIKREAVLHAQLEHKNVVRFFYCWIEELSPETMQMLAQFDSQFAGMDDEPSCISSCLSSSPSTPNGTMGGTSSYGPPQHIFIQMEYFKNGTLADYLASGRGKHVSREENLNFILMIVRGLEYIHASGVVHRDLKPTNIFLTDDFVAKIGDFGLSYTQGPNGGHRHTTESLETAYANEAATVETLGVGSPLYSSPEQLDTGKATAASDVYALGVLSYELYHHFGGTAHERIDTLQKLRGKKLSGGFQSKYPEEAELFLDMTRAKPNKRPTVKEVHDTVKRLVKQVRSTETQGSNGNGTSAD